MLSALTTNETLLLQASGWDPVSVCSGSAVYGMRRDSINTWGANQDDRASEAINSAMVAAVTRLNDSCEEASAHGVIGTRITTEIAARYIAVTLVGTAIKPSNTLKTPPRTFTSNLGVRDFIQLTRAGWQPVSLVSGGRFVRAYRRNPTQTAMQKVQNVELTNPTVALARARSETMLVLEQRARELSGRGVVQLSLASGPVSFATHVLSFVAWGTAVISTNQDSAYPAPRTAVTLNDKATAFAPDSLIGQVEEQPPPD